jgi:hypothetical protein
MSNPISQTEVAHRSRTTSVRPSVAAWPRPRVPSHAILLSICLLLCISSPGVSQTKSDSEPVDELRKLVEAQQRLIEAQQKRLELLEATMESLKRPGTAVVARQTVGTDPAAVVPRVEVAKVETPPPAPVTQAKPGSDITREGFGLKFYGFLRADLEADSRRMSFDSQLPFFVLSPADPSQAAQRTGNLTIHPRLTRVGFDISPPPLGDGWQATGKLEMDFYNSIIDRPAAGGPLPRDLVSNSRAALRIRLAYLQVNKGDFSFLAGQHWEVIAPLFPAYNADVLMWNAGNPGDRRPQLRLGYEPKVGDGKFSLVGAVGSSGAVDGQDLDGDGFRDGETAVAPTIQARAGYSRPLAGQTFSIGVWGHYAEQQLNRTFIAGRGEFDSSLAGLDFTIPIFSSLAVRGEVWKGKGLSDVRGGVGQAINPVTGEVIEAAGGWAELTYKFNSHYTVNLGSTLDNPFARDLTAANGRIRNRAHYIANRFSVGKGFSFGVDYGYWQTKYKGNPTGTNNRFNLYVQQAF